MKYLCLIYIDEPPERWAPVQLELACAATPKLARVLKASLCPADAATTVRKRNGVVLSQPGPATAASEQLAAIVLIEARDLNDALQAASQLPGARLGCIEVRPVRELAAQTYNIPTLQTEDRHHERRS